MAKFKPSTSFGGITAILFVFWLLITWSLHWQHLLTGILCSLGIAYFNRELLLQKEERPLLLPVLIGRWLAYVLSLILAVFKSNWEMARIILSPRLKISPGFVKYHTKLKKPLNRVILANSITLTPGTLTVEIEDDVFIVHAITRSGAEDVAGWDMMDKLVAIEEAEHDK